MAKHVATLLGFAMIAGIFACGGPDPVSSLSEPLKEKFVCPYIECTCSCQESPSKALLWQDPSYGGLQWDLDYNVCTVSPTGTCAGFNGAPCSGYPKGSSSKVQGKLVGCT
jgi:hypothetical protein